MSSFLEWCCLVGATYTLYHNPLHQILSLLIKIDSLFCRSNKQTKIVPNLVRPWIFCLTALMMFPASDFVSQWRRQHLSKQNVFVPHFCNVIQTNKQTNIQQLAAFESPCWTALWPVSPQWWNERSGLSKVRHASKRWLARWGTKSGNLNQGSFVPHYQNW